MVKRYRVICWCKILEKQVQRDIIMRHRGSALKEQEVDALQPWEEDLMITNIR